MTDTEHAGSPERISSLLKHPGSMKQGKQAYVEKGAMTYVNA